MHDNPSSLTFTTAREAKEFLAGCITATAEREGVEFSDLEQKMLFFSEGYDSLPDILTINEAFEQQYDQDEYEQKVARLIRDFHTFAGRESPELETRWKEALGRLEGEDHYLLVLASIAPESLSQGRNYPMGRMILLSTGFFAVLAFLYWLYLRFAAN